MGSADSVMSPQRPVVVVLYCRVSTRHQSEDGTSLDTQEERMRQHCALNGWTVAAVHREDVSGATEPSKRPGLMEALASLRDGSVLLVYRRDRLARDPYIAGAISRLVKDAGAVVRSLDVQDNESPESLLMASILDAFAQYERMVIAMRTYRGKVKRRAQGAFWGGEAPFGRRVSAVPGVLEDDPAEQQVIDFVRSLAKQGYTQREIRKLAPGRGGRELSPKTITAILKGEGR